MTMPLAVDLCCGLGGWTEGLLAEGWDVVGFDIEQHVYGEHRYPAQLVLQDILTLSGHQFRGKVQLIVASPPCQFFSYCAMPWTRAKELAKAVRADPARLEKELALFNACVRIGKEAECPIVIENVRGAIPWVGRSAWNFGSYHLWGEVPALMPPTMRAAQKGRLHGWTNGAWESDATKNSGGSWFNVGSPGQKVLNQNPVHALTADGVKGSEGYERSHPAPFGWKKPGTNSKSSARKAASARIAKIPLALASHIARVYYPHRAVGAA